VLWTEINILLDSNCEEFLLPVRFVPQGFASRIGTQVSSYFSHRFLQLFCQRLVFLFFPFLDVGCGSKEIFGLGIFRLLFSRFAKYIYVECTRVTSWLR
jgi:hypothetical protein